MKLVSIDIDDVRNSFVAHLLLYMFISWLWTFLGQPEFIPSHIQWRRCVYLDVCFVISDGSEIPFSVLLYIYIYLTWVKLAYSCSIVTIHRIRKVTLWNIFFRLIEYEHECCFEVDLFKCIQFLIYFFSLSDFNCLVSSHVETNNIMLI